MESRLKFCSVYLKEIESKLMHLRVSVDDDSDARAKIIEALNFIEQAQTAISEIQARVVDLRRGRTQFARRQSA